MLRFTASTPATKKALLKPLPAYQHSYNKINAPLCALLQDSIVRPRWESAQRHSAAHSHGLLCEWLTTAAGCVPVASHPPISIRNQVPKRPGHGKKELHNQQLQGLYMHSRHTPHQGRQAAVRKSSVTHTHTLNPANTDARPSNRPRQWPSRGQHAHMRKDGYHPITTHTLTIHTHALLQPTKHTACCYKTALAQERTFGSACLATLANPMREHSDTQAMTWQHSNWVYSARICATAPAAMPTSRGCRMQSGLFFKVPTNKMHFVLKLSANGPGCGAACTLP
jgi:hypothetical protein